MAVTETKKPQKGDLFNIASQTISCIKKKQNALQTTLATNCQNIKSLKTNIKEL